MPHEIVTQEVVARPIAAVRRRVRGGEVGSAWKPALDQVWAFLRTHDGVRTDGHNIFVYHHPARSGDPMDVDFGVEVGGAFEGEGEVVLTHTPAGHVVSTVHRGSYSGLPDAHGAILAWCASHGRTLAGHSWEIYGDPGADGQVEITIVYLLV